MFLRDNISKLNIIKYLGYGCFVLVSIFFRETTLSEKFIIVLIMLLDFINSQFRVNYLLEKKILFPVSIFSELTVILILYSFGYKNTIPFLLIPTIIDIGFFFPLRISLSFLSGILFFYLYSNLIFISEYDYTVSTIIKMLLLSYVYLFSLFISKSDSKKLEAQKFYDKLRISEEDLKKTNEELEAYSRTVEELTLLRERTRLSRELHDGVGHTLSTLIIQLQAIKTIIKKNPDTASKMMEEVIPYSKASLENVRSTVRELKPRELEAYEGIFAIEELIKNFRKFTGTDVKLIVSKVKYSLSSDQSSNLYRIVQECLSNSIRHGKAKNIIINIQFLEEKVYARIKDDGKGCSEIIPSFGLINIRERTEALNGQCNFISGENKGFEVTVTLPRYADSSEYDL